MKLLRILIPLLAASLPLVAQEPALEVAHSGVALRGGRFHLKITSGGFAPATAAEILVDGRAVQQVTLTPGEQEVILDEAKASGPSHQIEVRAGGVSAATSVRTIPGWLSILPPIVAIALALAFKEVLLSLSLGIFAGALILYQWNPITAFARSIDSIVVPAVADLDHAKIIVFSMLLCGMVGVISRSGGTLGIVDRVRKFATTARRGQLSAWIMGVLIFFDDYANTLIVGSTMRPVTDRLRISREKLAYIVDSTAAPVASIVPISTWIGFEVGLIAAAFTQLNITLNPYVTFVETIPFRFYPILALVLGFTIAVTCRDFGPMLRAELRASSTGEVVAPGDTPLADYSSEALTPPDGMAHRAINAWLPIVTVVVVTIAGMYVSGAAKLNRADHPGTLAWLREVFGEAASLDSLLWGSLAAVVVAIALPLIQRLMSVRQTMTALVEGFKSMLLAIVVLILAWGIGRVTGELHTADYVVGVTQGVLSPHWLPVIVFVTSAAIAFATGTSWGTMGILMPLVIPVAHRLAMAGGHAPGSELHHVLLLGTISSVLAGSVWGDHCSPISDTTILSSMGSGCDHIAHVRTQLPYALAVGFLGMIAGDIPTAYGMSPWISLLVGAAVIVAVVRLFGTRSDWGGAPSTVNR
ncbi:MAG TPA: Na+/H+ antiporter NhaC family protein [Thermoanaerobaculia bacterium]|nr:Na+/H+ antiporter NhaC family protein [Thermoanaerobaculia bacterium]